MAFIAPRSFEVSDKRQRVVTTSRAKRPIDKVIIVVNFSAVSATDENEEIISASYPATVTGLRWDFDVRQAGGTGVCDMTWAIVFLRDGETLDTLSFTAGITFYKPEQNCLVYGFQVIENKLETKHVKGSTKTMRKLMVGDSIHMIVKGVGTDTVTVKGAVQLFLKG